MKFIKRVGYSNTYCSNCAKKLDPESSVIEFDFTDNEDENVILCFTCIKQLEDLLKEIRK